MYAQRSAYIAGFISLSISSTLAYSPRLQPQVSLILVDIIPQFHFHCGIRSFSQIVQVRQFGDIVFFKGFFSQFGDFGFSGLAILK